MGIKKTIGGDRLGSGNRMKQEMHNFFRSNHNLSCSRTSSMAAGVLYPMYVNIGLEGDTFDIDLNAFVRTVPTEGPMFGAFKLQVDVFKSDMRLYQAILHNNTTEIGMNMNQVLLPKLELQTRAKWTGEKWKQQVSKTALQYYLGLSGIGSYNGINANIGDITRKINAIPTLAYYDIFKNYYANKQEDIAYGITSGTYTETIAGEPPVLKKVTFCDINDTNCIELEALHEELFYVDVTQGAIYHLLHIHGNHLLSMVEGQKIPNVIVARAGSQTQSGAFMFIPNDSTDTELVFGWTGTSQSDYFHIRKIEPKGEVVTRTGDIRLVPFNLKNIDDMRRRILTTWNLGEEFVIDSSEKLAPYNLNTQVDEDGECVIKNAMQGLVVKCYQSDIFNNWLDTEWYNKISQISRVSTASGGFTMDALNFAKKIYDHYNRVAISGGSYDDWRQATYGQKVVSSCEKPVYCGGMSSEVIFDEVVSSVTASPEEPLGSLGGRGTLKGRRGGNVIVKCDQACVIMVMVSLTPRLNYTQGNSWYLTELDSMDDLHKPMFDRIGFQDLMVEQMAWWDTRIDMGGAIIRSSAGKQPAWLNYMTDVDKAFGDFAEEDGKGYMVLQRLYSPDTETKRVADVTTYIDPTKYNYPFAVKTLSAQNFWVFLNLGIKARRLMSAKQIPNL